MSRWWRSQLRIAVAPRQITLVEQSGGYARRSTSTRTIPCSPIGPDESPWRTPLSVLEGTLSELNANRSDTTVLLSNHFVRYALIKQGDQVTRADEELALVRHYFNKIYGDISDQWTFRLSNVVDQVGLRIGCAIDTELNESLRTLFRSTRLSLRSVQPYFTAAFNHWRHSIERSSWFALVETGHLCISELQDGRWRSIKSLKIGDDWLPDLIRQLTRERLLADQGNENSAHKRPVFVYAPELALQNQEVFHDHFIHLLKDSSPAMDGENNGYALVMIK